MLKTEDSAVIVQVVDAFHLLQESLLKTGNQ